MRKKLVILISVLVFILSLVGCGEKSKEAVSERGNRGALSKDKWIGLLGDGFGYNTPLSDTSVYSDVRDDNEYFEQIQACEEWGVITERDKFEPNKEVTWEYALQTAVRAVGIDHIRNAGGQVEEDNLIDFFVSNIANIGNTNLSSSITLEDAEEIIKVALEYSYNLSPMECFEYTYADNVYEVEAGDIILRGDGQSAWVINGTTYSRGDIIYIHPSETDNATAIRVVSCEGDNLLYEEAEISDVYSELRISGSYEPVIISAEGTSEEIDVSYHSNDTGYMMSCMANKVYDAIPAVQSGKDIRFVRTGITANGNSVRFDTSIGEDENITVTISDIRVNTDIDYNVFSGLKKAEATVSFNDEIVAAYSSDHCARTIPLGSIALQLGSTPCNVELSLILNIGFDGSATLTYTSHLIGRVAYKKDCGLIKSLCNENSNLDFHAEATVTAEPTAKVDLRLFDRSVANLKITSGVVAIATLDADIMDNEPDCLDIYMYVPLRWSVNEDGCILTNINGKLRYSAVIWDSANSNVTKKIHWEDGVLVEACTRGESNKVDTPVTNEEDMPYDEYKIFDFEVIDFEVIRLYSSKVYLEKDETMGITFSSIPNGYSVDDMVYVIDDPSVCKISDGRITGISSGSTTVKVSTTDGKYNTYFTVTVKGDFNDMTNFQPL